MAGCIEDLFTQYLWDFDRLKGLNCSPVEECFQDFAHGYPLCCYYNIEVLQVQHTKTQCRRWVYTAVLRKRFGARSRLRGRCHVSGDFQSEVVVHGLAEFLLAAEIPLGCLNRCMSK
jgi:hypothetical protein